MQSKLRAILGDRILVVLVLALLVQSYRVADRYEVGGFGEEKQPLTLKNFVDRLSEDGSIELPSGDGSTVTLNLPRGEDGKPIDIRKLFTEGGQRLEEGYLEAERQYGSEDPRTVVARSGYAAVLLYRGEQARAMELYQKNYDIAILAEDMAPDQRLAQLLLSATALNEYGGVDYSHRLMRAALVARAQAQRAPAQAARILNKVARMHMDNADFETARLYYSEAASLPLNKETDASIVAETLMGLAVAFYRSGDADRAEAAAEQLLVVAYRMPEGQAAAREMYENVASKIISRVEATTLGKIISNAEHKTLLPERDQEDGLFP